MAKYVTFFTYTSDAWARMIQSPGDRTATIRQVADSLGGSVECVYWVFGTHNGMVITDPRLDQCRRHERHCWKPVPLRLWRRMSC